MAGSPKPEAARKRCNNQGVEATHSSRDIRVLRILGIGAVVVLLFTLLRNAWLSDDCYITFRTIWNFWQGFGLRWNVAERVQTYTHPLWMLFLLPIYGVTGKAWLSAWIAGIGCTLATAVVVFRSAPNRMLGLAGLILLLSSRAFIDFGTSGLENPLSWLLLVFFVHILLKADPPGSPLAIGLLGSLLVLNRLDHLFLVLPPLFVLFLRLDGKGRRQLLLGGLPLVFWLTFALIYYGTPLPNTFYAKAVTGFPRPILLVQGLRCFADSLANDFATLPVIVAAVLLPLNRHCRRMWPLALGLLLDLAYVLWVGGDFMSGRFFADPFVLAVAMLVQWRGRARWVLSGATVIFVGALLHPHHPIKTGPDYYQDRAGRERTLFPAGIVDEKGMAWRRTSLLGSGEKREFVELERRLASQTATFDLDSLRLEMQVAVGMPGYACGPNVHILDRLAITDPLLARLPARDLPVWRIGHFFRWVPFGYPESILHGDNRIADPQLRPFYDDLAMVTRGAIWSAERWGAIFRLNFGISGRRVNRDFYRNPPSDAVEGKVPSISASFSSALRQSTSSGPQPSP
jgi:arabinofuranosyltransferase